ncbi:MAG: hypothetical protein ACI9F9_001249 [Candidatus Paceibacteria bacterium]|jgi:hypothetical protein
MHQFGGASNQLQSPHRTREMSAGPTADSVLAGAVVFLPAWLSLVRPQGGAGGGYMPVRELSLRHFRRVGSGRQLAPSDSEGSQTCSELAQACSVRGSRLVGAQGATPGGVTVGRSMNRAIAAVKRHSSGDQG